MRALDCFSGSGAFTLGVVPDPRFIEHRTPSVVVGDDREWKKRLFCPECLMDTIWIFKYQRSYRWGFYCCFCDIIYDQDSPEFKIIRDLRVEEYTPEGGWIG